MGLSLCGFCPKGADSEPLLYSVNKNAFTRYEVVLHRPLPAGALEVTFPTGDDCVITKLNNYILEEQGVKVGHFVRSVNKVDIKDGFDLLQPHLLVDKKFPLTIVLAKKKSKNLYNPNDDNASDISYDSFTSMNGLKLYNTIEVDHEKLNHSELVEKNRELEAALSHLQRDYRHARKNYVEKAAHYKKEDQLRRQELLKKVKEEQIKAERAQKIGGDRVSHEPGPGGASDTLVQLKKIPDLDGFLFKFGKGGKKKAKRKFVKFSVGALGDNLNDQKPILQYSADAADTNVKEHLIEKVIPDALDLDATFDEAILDSVFGLKVRDSKGGNAKTIAFHSDNKRSKEIWVKHIEDMISFSQNWGDEKNVFIQH